MGQLAAIAFGKLSDTELNNLAQGVIYDHCGSKWFVSEAETLVLALIFLRFESTRGIRPCMSGLYEPSSYET